MNGDHGSLIAHHAIDRREPVLMDAAHTRPGSIDFERAGQARYRQQHLRVRKRNLEGPCHQQLVAAGIDVIALPVGDGAVRVEVQIAPDQEQADHRAGFDRGAGFGACLATLLRSAAGEDPARHGFEAHGAEDRRITLDEFAREAPEPQRQP